VDNGQGNLARGNTYIRYQRHASEKSSPDSRRVALYLECALRGSRAGTRHDYLQAGGFRKLAAVKAAKAAGGCWVSTNTTTARKSFRCRELFGQLAGAGVDGILVAPGFSYEDVIRDVFLTRNEIVKKFQEIRTWGKRFPIISNPLYMEFLAGKRSLTCTPWGNPTRNSQGWKSPCYLITDTHYSTFAELMEKTDWEHYASGADPRCEQCMVHCGFEPTIVRQLGQEPLPCSIEYLHPEGREQ